MPHAPTISRRFATSTNALPGDTRFASQHLSCSYPSVIGTHQHPTSFPHELPKILTPTYHLSPILDSMAHTIPVANTITCSRQDTENHNNETCTSQQQRHHLLVQQSPTMMSLHWRNAISNLINRRKISR